MLMCGTGCAPYSLTRTRRHPTSVPLLWPLLPCSHATSPPRIIPCNVQVDALFGEQGGQKRAHVLERFNRGHLDALVTTDAFGLGLDYKDVDVVMPLASLAPATHAYIARCASKAGIKQAKRTGMAVWALIFGVLTHQIWQRCHMEDLCFVHY